MKLLLSSDDATTHTASMSAPSSDGSGGEMAVDQSSPKDDRPSPPHGSVNASASDLICNPLRTIVSQNRRRYHDDGFNLDLTYITDRIIAMGYPADTKEAIYRNSMESTVQFLEYYHKGHYKVFNLRGQYVYDTKKFHDRVLSFEMVDHHPPRLEIMAPFCREVHAYLSAHPRNIVAVHCKAGKGRTGVMICAYLCYISFYKLPRQNMDYYSIVRTRNNKGVTIPSQRRYVYYFSHLREKELNYIPLRCELVGIFLERPPKQSSFPLRKGLEVRVVNGDVTVFQGKPFFLSKEEWEEEERMWEKGVSRGEDSHDDSGRNTGRDGGGGTCISRRAYGWQVPVDKRVFLEGDVRVEIHSVKPLKTKIGHCWFNTMFTCETFCGGAYLHGDEAFPYPPGGTTISEGSAKCGSTSLPSSPPSTPKMSGGGLSAGRRAPSIDVKKASRTPRLSSVMKKRTSSVMGGEKEDKKGRGGALKTESSPQSSRDTSTPFTLVAPPGLDAHCPESSLKLIYEDSERRPPREEIEKMVEHAHTHNMVCDWYNERRLSVPHEGIPVEKSPEGRPYANGPYAIMKEKDEHVTVFSVLEMDKACKNKDLDTGFRMLVVTRCLSDKEADLRLAHKFIEVTREKQAKRDEEKREKVEARQRRLASGGVGGSDEGADHVCASKEWREDDPRLEDPHLKKFFYRQRADSVSRYPSHNHRCPLVEYTTPAKMRVDCSGEKGVESLQQAPSTSRERCMEGRKEDEKMDQDGDWMDKSDLLVSDLLDHDVRSYHPDEERWKKSSGASSTTLSSESDPAQEDGNEMDKEDGGTTINSSASTPFAIPSQPPPSPSPPLPTKSIPS